MRALVQRVARAQVSVDGETVAQIGPGLLVLLGVTHSDDRDCAERLAAKIRSLRIFGDAAGRMNEPLGEREICAVSQFTLYGETSRGTRPSFAQAAEPEQALELYEHFCAELGAVRGRFGAMMQVELVNDGPVTLMLEVAARGGG
jgi:D-tyrosyl-tRNA(Tyr) deacylase